MPLCRLLIVLMAFRFVAPASSQPDLAPGDADTGRACAVMLLRWLGSGNDVAGPANALVEDSLRLDLAGIAAVIGSTGLHVAVVNTTVPGLVTLNRPAILRIQVPSSDPDQWRERFVTLLSISGTDSALVFDPSLDGSLNGSTSLARLFRDWSGQAVIASVAALPPRELSSAEGQSRNLLRLILKWGILPVAPIAISSWWRCRKRCGSPS